VERFFDDPGKTVRIVAFFVAGVVLSVGGALIYATFQGMRSPVASQRAETVIAEQHAPTAASNGGASVEQPDSTSQSAVPSDATPNTDTPPKEDGGVSYATVPTPRPANAKPAPAVTVPISQAPKLPALTQLPKPQPYAGSTSSYTSTSRKASAPVQQTTQQASTPTLTATSSTSQSSTPQQEQPLPVISSQAQSERTPQPHTVTLPTSTEICVKLLDPVSSESSRPGDVFRGTLESPIIHDGFVIADRGSLVYGRVYELQKAHWFKGTADLALTLIQIHTTDGQAVRITTSPWEERGRSRSLEKRAKRATEDALGVLKSAITREGKSQESNSALDSTAQQPTVTRNVISVPRGTQLTFLLDSPITLTEHLNSSR
jgi:hypothetical protein